MYSIGIISELAAETKEGWFIGRFLKKDDPWFSKKFEVAFQVLKSDMKAEVISHAHQYIEEITLVLKGCLRVEVDGQKIELKAGEIILVKPRTSTKRIGADDATELLVFKTPSLSQDKYFTNGQAK